MEEIKQLVVIVGIDPGAGGGIGIYVDTPHRSALKMPATEAELVRFFRHASGYDPRVFMEKVHAMPGNGVVSMFSFGQQVGSIKTALAAAGLLDRVQFITPQEWQRALGCLTKGDKKVSKKAAETMFPIQITHATADALLITEYGRRVVSGEITRHETATVARKARTASKRQTRNRKASVSKATQSVRRRDKAVSVVQGRKAARKRAA